MTKVVLDTNALLMPFQFNVDIMKELGRLLGATEVYVPKQVLSELARIKDRRALAAVKLAKRFNIMPSVGKGDDAVLALASELRAVLLTNDKGLKRRARSAGLKVAFLRGKDHLALE